MKMVKRRKQIGFHRKTLGDVTAAVNVFANAHKVKPSEVRFETGGWGTTYMVVTTPETTEETEKRLRAAAAKRKRRAAEKRREEKWKRQREAEKAVNVLTTSTEKVTRLNDELAAAVVTVLEANPKVKSKVLKKVST